MWGRFATGRIVGMNAKPAGCKPASHEMFMGVIPSFRIACAALLVHKGRSVLTSLGIVIGTGAVIAMVSAAGGARQKLDERLDNVGKNLILIRAGSRTQHGALA